MHVKPVQQKKTTREGKMDYRESYVDLQWRCIESQGILGESSPEDLLIHREDMRQLASSLIKLNKMELVCLMLMNYDEVGKTAIEVQEYIKRYFGKNTSKYKVVKFHEAGLRKLRTRLRNIYDWQR